jgi:UDP-N-acetylmuramyl pentapeptide phosphotransferase/UDP-N-acetylglucosamine-1-phosphate transferase
MAFTEFLLPALVSFGVCLLIVVTGRWHYQYSADQMTGVQKVHEESTARVGGIGIACGVLASFLSLSPSALSFLLLTSLWAAVPALSAGLLEDLSKRVGPLVRLIAAMASGVLAYGLTGVAMQDTGLPPLDAALRFMPFAVLFTGFAVGGVVNAINMIDGLHGLASGVCVILLAAIGAIAAELGDAVLRDFCGVVIAATLGFFLVNWPTGKIFLGDGGAYLLGFFVAWASVLLCMRHPEVNGWTAVMVCAYPLLEVAFSMRRRIRHGFGQLSKPDRQHLHQLLHGSFVGRLFPSLPLRHRNAATAPIVWVLAALPALWAVVFAVYTPMLVLGFGLAVVGYAVVYGRLLRLES